MLKLRVSAIAATVTALTLGLGGAAWAASGGDSNAGDVWLDNVGQPPGPGHEMDPHLACQDINLWGSGLADSSGTFAIDGWPPSGSQEVDYSGTWSYSHNGSRKSGDQIIAVINVQQLIATAQANGDKPAAQGYHFKLDFSQDPQKHKTFWVNCPAPSSGGSTSRGSTSTTTGGTTSSTTSTSNTSTSSGSSERTTSTMQSTRRSVRAAHRHRRHHARRKHRRLVKPRRHHRAHRRSVSAVSESVAEFTG